MRFTWSKTRDEEERVLWSEIHRTSKRPLGQIVKDVMARREGVWIPTMETKVDRATPASAPVFPKGKGKGKGKFGDFVKKRQPLGGKGKQQECQNLGKL